MKKIFTFILVTFLISNIFASSFKIIDYKGASLGSDIPEWVINKINNNNRKLNKQFGKKGINKCWVLENQGENLDILKADCGSNNVLFMILDNLRASADDVLGWTEEFSEKDKNLIAGLLEKKFSVLTFNGLELEAEYWIRVISDEDETYYLYYSVITVPKELYEKQMYKLLNELEYELQNLKLPEAGIADLRNALVKSPYLVFIEILQL